MKFKKLVKEWYIFNKRMVIAIFVILYTVAALGVVGIIVWYFPWYCGIIAVGILIYAITKLFKDSKKEVEQ